MIFAFHKRKCMIQSPVLNICKTLKETYRCFLSTETGVEIRGKKWMKSEQTLEGSSLCGC